MAKMAEQEDPNLTSSHRHTKITAISRATIDEKDQKTSRKDLSTTKDKRTTTLRWVGRTEIQYSQDPHPLGCTTHK